MVQYATDDRFRDDIQHTWKIGMTDRISKIGKLGCNAPQVRRKLSLKYVLHLVSRVITLGVFLAGRVCGAFWKRRPRVSLSPRFFERVLQRRHWRTTPAQVQPCPHRWVHHRPVVLHSRPKRIFRCSPIAQQLQQYDNPRYSCSSAIILRRLHQDRAGSHTKTT